MVTWYTLGPVVVSVPSSPAGELCPDINPNQVVLPVADVTVGTANGVEESNVSVLVA